MTIMSIVMRDCDRAHRSIDLMIARDENLSASRRCQVCVARENAAATLCPSINHINSNVDRCTNERPRQCCEDMKGQERHCRGSLLCTQHHDANSSTNSQLIRSTSMPSAICCCRVAS